MVLVSVPLKSDIDKAPLPNTGINVALWRCSELSLHPGQRIKVVSSSVVSSLSAPYPTTSLAGAPQQLRRASRVKRGIITRPPSIAAYRVPGMIIRQDEELPLSSRVLISRKGSVPQASLNHSHQQRRLN